MSDSLTPEQIAMLHDISVNQPSKEDARPDVMFLLALVQHLLNVNAELHKDATFADCISCCNTFPIVELRDGECHECSEIPEM